jgi:tetratricopeptide (TPR) repeat protein
MKISTTFLMRKISLYLLILLISAFNNFLQAENNRDSLLTLIENEIQDTSKVLLYSDLVRNYLTIDIDSAVYFAKTGLFIAEKSDYVYGTGVMYQLLGHAMVVYDDFDAAKANYLKALAYFIEAKDLSAQTTIYLVLGNVYYVQNNYPEALKNYITGERIADSLNNIDLLPDYYNNLANIYYTLENYQQSLEYYNRALKLSELNGNIETTISILVNMAKEYIDLNEFQQANIHIDRALELMNTSKSNEVYKVQIYEAKGELELKSKNYSSALDIYKKALGIIDEMGPGFLGPVGVYKVDCHTNIGRCYFELGNYKEAKENLLLGYDLAINRGLIRAQRDAAFYLSKVFDSTGDLESGYSYFKVYKSLYDSISNEYTSKKITQLQMQFEFDKKTKEQELEQVRKEVEQKRKELLLYLIIAGIFTGLIILFLFYMLQKSKIKRIHLERKNLELDLDSRNKELTTNVMYLLKKNEFIESISEKLKKTKQYFKPENRSFLDNIIKELEASLSSDSWEEFEIRFQQVHKDFYSKLNEQFPNLSPNEQKLCAFLRLNMSTKEISAITYQSDKSIFMARYRLRKKLGLDEHANLITFLNKL